MKITRENYEAWFIDHIEGRLSAEAEQELRVFLLLHPDLRDELEQFEPVTLEKEAPGFGDKKSLKKEITAENRDGMLIAYVEETLSASDRRLIEENSAPDFRKDLAMYIKTKLPAEEIAFPAKGSLYRRSEPVIRPLYYRIAAAASVLLVATMLLFRGDDSGKGIALRSSSHEKFPLLSYNNSGTVQNPESVLTVPVTAPIYSPVIHSSPQKEPRYASMMEIHPRTINTVMFSGNIRIQPVTESPEGSMVNYNPDENAGAVTLSDAVTEKVKDRIYRNEDEQRVPGKIRWFEIVDMAGRGLAALTGKPFRMNKQTTEDGKLLAYRIDFGKYTIEKELNP
ncbi:MAG: hypothetical protein IT233_07985 [Bacteroidia bacterium]|nr:hypothetical protein [Bacteroidia bacterium]